ncbi:hypothetical protein M6B38_357355 [Iris pallida]|uniref:Uncharacterized protein n=1 Tax=Iris pallida TaxID=29817 RepID=A0AAX6GM05_IRIPA|nr:hypothetical protein M6B38_235565 [Iris pallida]KAJ6829562.1 hypothetical protein M6B38_357355 [Iris pallida]
MLWHYHSRNHRLTTFCTQETCLRGCGPLYLIVADRTRTVEASTTFCPLGVAPLTTTRSLHPPSRGSFGKITTNSDTRDTNIRPTNLSGRFSDKLTKSAGTTNMTKRTSGSPCSSDVMFKGSWPPYLLFFFCLTFFAYL